MEEKYVTPYQSKIFQTILAWLLRKQSERSHHVFSDLPVVLSTDIGLKRQQNQDRVVALRIRGKQKNEPPLAVVVLADGMGGMQDGADCAAIAIASFLHAIVENPDNRLENKVRSAINFANRNVFSFASGDGGTTLSALVYRSSKEAFIANVGDSRIYSWGAGTHVERLTVDDSLEEAVGGHGRELLHFIGMGDGIRPHIMPIDPTANQIALTTDGIHFIDPSTLYRIFLNTNDPKSLVERLSALSRWCGGHDNASIAYVNIRQLEALPEHASDLISLADPFGALSLVPIPNVSPPVAAASPPKEQSHPNRNPDKPKPSRASKRKTLPRSTKKSKKELESNEEENIQLEIKIESSGIPNERNNDQ
jgi:serine/threonine protein phosphatase PrpC